jgi:hypothetical protein
MLGFKEFVQEENKQGDIGTDKLTANRKRQTPCEPMITPEPLKNFQKEYSQV